MTTEAEKAAEEFAHIKVKELMLEGVIPAGAGTLDLVEYGFLVGYNKGHAAALMPRRIDPNDESTFPLTWLCLLFDKNDKCWHDASKWNPGDTRLALEGGVFTHWLPIPPTPQREE